MGLVRTIMSLTMRPVGISLHQPSAKISLIFILLIHLVSVGALHFNQRSPLGEASISSQLVRRNPRQVESLLPQSTSTENLIIQSPTTEQSQKKRRRIIRRKKQPKGSSTSIPTVTFSVTPYPPEAEQTEPSIKVFSIPPAIPSPPVESINVDSRISSFKTYPRKRVHNHHKVPEVWKIPYLNDEILSQSDGLKSQVGKRESAEGPPPPPQPLPLHSALKSELNPQFQNFTVVHPTEGDLHTDESSNPYLNTSTPISNELQNSLQFTLQMLHPLLNSDSVLAEKSSKIPEDKQVAVTHSLSDSVAQTPIAHDLGFLPTHLRKRHPLLNHDSIFTENSASKTGIRTNQDVHPPNWNSNIESTHIVEENTTPNSPATTTTTTKATTTEGHKQGETTTVRLPKKPIQTVTSVPLEPISQTVKSSSGSENIAHTISTSRSPLLPSKLPTPVSVIPSSIKNEMAAKVKDNEATSQNSVLGVLNITEVSGSNSDENLRIHLEDPNIRSPQNSINNSSRPPPVRELDKFPPVIMLPIDDTFIRSTSSSPLTRSSSTTTTTTPDSISSAEVSSAEQLLIEELLGIRAPVNSEPPSVTTTEPQVDSNEQLLQLFNLIQSQEHAQNKRNPNLPSDLVQTPNPNPISTSSQENFQNILQALLNSQQSGSSNLNNPQFDLAAFLNSASNGGNPLTTSLPLPTLSPTLTSTTLATFLPPSSSSSSGTNGLSDADLKSIFALLDIQPPISTTTAIVTPKSTTTTTTTSTTTTTTTTPKPTTTTLTTTTTTPRPTTTTTLKTTTPTTPSPPRPTKPQQILRQPQLTTTLHPALQSMLDLFTNQLKPFQSIPPGSSQASILSKNPQPLAQLFPSAAPPPIRTIPTTTTTAVPLVHIPTSTPNSLDILSQLLNLGSLNQGQSKVNPVRSTPSPAQQLSLASIFGTPNNNNNINNQQNLPRSTPSPEFSLASIFGNANGNTNVNNNIFPSPSNFPSPPVVPIQSAPEVSGPSESNQLLNFFGNHPTTPPPAPSGLYYWLDLNAFLGGDPKADPMAGIRPKIGNKYPFIKVKR